MASVAACCPTNSPDTCGLDTSFLSYVGVQFDEPCQALDQAGNEDARCPAYTDNKVDFMGQSVPINDFPGCCRADTGTCGYRVDDVASGPLTLVHFGFGCVDSKPFLKGGQAKSCGTSGAGGAPSAGATSGGEAPASGGAGSAGAPTGGVAGAN